MSAAVSEPARVRGLDGVWGRAALDTAAQLRLFAALVFRDAPEDGWLHVWAARRRADGRLVAFRRDPLAFVRDADAFVAQALAWHARGLEVFGGVLPRTRAAARQPRGRRQGRCCGPTSTSPPRWRGSRRSAPSTPPTTWPPRAAAGATPPGCSTRARPGRELAAACRRLAGAVGGDLAVCHPGASLRLPGTRNGKPGAGDCRLLAADLALPAYRLGGAGRRLAGSRRRRRGAVGNGAGGGGRGRRAPWRGRRPAGPDPAAGLRRGALRGGGAGRRRGDLVPAAGP